MASFKSNRQILTKGTDIYARKKEKKNAGVEQVEFDAESRTDYLTGFHKRKMKRQEMAAEAAVKRAKQERLEERKSIREAKKEQLKKDLEELQRARSGTSGIFDVSDSDKEEEEKEEREEDDYSDWEGINEQERDSKKGILKRVVYEEEDSDEEGATVVIEQMEDRDPSASSTGKDNFVFPEMSKQVLSASIQKAKLAALQAYAYGFPEESIYRDESDPFGFNDDYGSDDDQQKKKKSYEIDIAKDLKSKGDRQRKPKKKARYLTKSERSANVRKERNRSKEKRERAKAK